VPVTMQEVRAALEPEEPDYTQAAQMGSEAIPHLEELVGETDALLASKATYLASLIEDQRSSRVLKRAAESERPEVRVAAASGAGNLSEQEASDVLVPLLEDRDVGVRKTALKAVPDRASSELRDAVDSLTDTDSSLGIRELSGQVADRLRPDE
jgi:HEAT repeat protein